jgi:predicted nucleic acid-binding protein
MIFVDTNVIMYAVGRAHPLRSPSREFFFHAVREGVALCTSAEVMQELLHAYLPVERFQTLESARNLIDRCIHSIWPLESDDIRMAYDLIQRHPGLSSRDIVHLACCLRRGVSKIETHDIALKAAFSK